MRWILIFAGIVLNCGSNLANAAPDEVLRPKGVPPEFALLRSSGGKFILSRVVTSPVRESQNAVEKSGQSKRGSRPAARLASEYQTEEEFPIDGPW